MKELYDDKVKLLFTDTDIYAILLKQMIYTMIWIIIIICLIPATTKRIISYTALNKNS